MFPASAPHVRSRIVTLASGLQLRVAESGDEQAKPVVLLHGWGASLYMWRDWFAPVAASGRRAIALDLPGHGLSSKPDDDDVYRLPSLVAAIAEFLDSEGLGELDVVAQSMAGTIALELLLRRAVRVRRVVLVNPACFGRVRLERLFPLASWKPIDRVLPRLVRRTIVARTHRLQFDDPKRITRRDEDEYWAPSQFPAYARAMRRLVHVFEWKRARAEEMAERLRGAEVPVMVVLGERDTLVRDAIPYVAALKAAGAPLESHVVERGGHAVNEELPDEVAKIALAFLGQSERDDRK